MLDNICLGTGMSNYLECLVLSLPHALVLNMDFFLCSSCFGFSSFLLSVSCFQKHKATVAHSSLLHKHLTIYCMLCSQELSNLILTSFAVNSTTVEYLLYSRYSGFQGRLSGEQHKQSSCASYLLVSRDLKFQSLSSILPVSKN